MLDCFSPGPLTVVLPKKETISEFVTAGLETVGVRVPAHPIAIEILRSAAVPVAAPSANQSGRPSGTTWKAVAEDLDGRIDAIFTADSSSIGIESTVVDCSAGTPLVLRPGAITLEQLQKIVPQTRELQADEKSEMTASGRQVNSPGILHPHYQPRAEVMMVDLPQKELTGEQSKDAAYCGLDVFDGEPGPIDPRWMNAPRAILSPHIGSATLGTRGEMARLVAQGVLDALDKRRPAHLANPGVWR